MEILHTYGPKIGRVDPQNEPPPTKLLNTDGSNLAVPNWYPRFKPFPSILYNMFSIYMYTLVFIMANAKVSKFWS